MSKCVVLGCKSVYNPFNGSSFHRITRNKKYLPLWEKAIRFRTDSDPDHAKICNLHFKLEDFIEGRDKRVLKPTAVPSINCMEYDSDDDEEDDENLSTLKETLIASNASSTNNGAKEISRFHGSNINTENVEMVISCGNSAQPSKSQNLKKTSNTGVQTKLKTDKEISLQARVKLLQLRLRRRDAKISHMKTVLSMIKKHTKGTDMAYKLCCELQNISELPELDKSNSKDNLMRIENPVSGNENEETSGDDMGSFVEVVHSPNLKTCNSNSLKIMKRAARRPGRGHVPKRLEKVNPEPDLQIEVKEVFSPRNKRFMFADEEVAPEGSSNPFAGSKSHRSTYYRPSKEDVGQLTDLVLPPYCNLLQGNPEILGTMKLKDLKNACQGPSIETCSKFVEPVTVLKHDEHVMVDLREDKQWQIIDSVSQVDNFLFNEKQDEVQNNKKQIQELTCNIRISNTPRVRRIAEKFSKFRRNNIELRKLEERVVCLEYDVFHLDASNPAAPVQKMRAFFSIKTNEIDSDNDKENVTFIPSGIKRNYNIDDEDLQKLDKKEIEIIDEELAENRSLLEDLKRVLRRKQVLKNKKREQTLDPMGLYEMAKRESPDYDYSNTNILSKAGLQEIKELILKKCTSSAYGIDRKTIQSHKKNTTADDAKFMSESLIWELMHEPDSKC